MLGHSLARDFDFQYERKDLIRVWEEFSGPEGVFLKTGKDVEIRGSSAFPFFRWVKREDPERDKRLYFSKSYIYPLIAAPFIVFFGTNGFLVLHAILIAFDLLVIYLFVLAATKSNWAAVPMSIAFLAASVVPVYFVWLMPELLNFSLVLYAVFFWAYKEVAGEAPLHPTHPLQPSHPFLPGRRPTTSPPSSSASRRSRSRRTCSCSCRWFCSPRAGASGHAPPACW